MWGGAAVFGAPAFTLSDDPIALVRDEARFTEFARQVATQVDEMMKAHDAAAEKLLIALRLHVALHLHEDKLALQLAEQIRASQVDPGERAHSGLTTRALVASGRNVARFEVDFTRLLRELPRDASTRAALARAQRKIEELSEESLLDDVRKNVIAPLARGESCTLQMVDELIRSGHRLRMILPVRAAMLRAYATAIAAQDADR